MMLQQWGSIVASEPIGNAKYALASCEQHTGIAAGAATHAFKLVSQRAAAAAAIAAAAATDYWIQTVTQ